MTESMKKVRRWLWHCYLAFIKFFRRIGLKNKKVSIISNNCGGGFISQYYGLKYNSPTAGLFFESSDYLRFVKNLKHYLSIELEFIDSEKSKNIDYVKSTNMYGEYPVARLDDIEIYFMHYKTEKEAREKWERRVKRVDFDNLLVILFENETTTEEILREFDSLEINHMEMVFKKYDGLKFAYYNQNVADHNLHHWKPKWVMQSLNWKKVLNNIKR